jgi:hypothetical protein
MIPMMPCCTLGNPLTNITGSYHKATTFIIENNVIPLECIPNRDHTPKPEVTDEGAQGDTVTGLYGMLKGAIQDMTMQLVRSSHLDLKTCTR